MLTRRLRSLHSEPYERGHRSRTRVSRVHYFSASKGRWQHERAIRARARTGDYDLSLRLYALEVRGITQRAMDDLVRSGGTEPFPAYSEVDYIDGINPCPEEWHESAMAALQASIDAIHHPNRPGSDRPMPPGHNGGVLFTRDFTVD